MTQRYERIELVKGSHENIIAGDLIEFPSIGYAHWAVYMGDKYVVHLTGIREDVVNTFFEKWHVSRKSKFLFSIGSEEFRKAYIRKELLWTVAGNFSGAFRNNGKDKDLRPFESDKVAKRAESFMNEAKDEPVRYNLINANCEHFANYCRYNVIHSQQVLEIGVRNIFRKTW